jgi:hypothetical protein
MDANQSFGSNAELLQVVRQLIGLLVKLPVRKFVHAGDGGYTFRLSGHLRLEELMNQKTHGCS